MFEPLYLVIILVPEDDKILDFLINEVGISVNEIGDRRLSALHLACEYGNVHRVRYLVEKGASTILRNAQVYNSLEIAIMKQHEEVVQCLLARPNWRMMMRNAQPIDSTDAYDTPMRKFIRFMPKETIKLIEEQLTRKVGGEGQKVSKLIYDYEFYEDMNMVKEWYSQGTSSIAAETL